MELAPIALFVYSRPEHTLQVLQALEKSDFAKQSVLYVFADGPKPGATEETLDRIRMVRSIAREHMWCKEVHVIERDSNIGLANSIISGVTQVVNSHGKIIV